MKEKYKILLLEDFKPDADLLKLEILKVIPEAVFEISFQEAVFVEKLNSFQPDVVISDFYLIDFNGLDALRISKELCPQTPFIIVSGAQNENIAIECVKHGAIDYVLKDSPRRLGLAVLNAINQLEIYNQNLLNEKLLLEKEQNYFHLFNTVNEAIYILNTSFEFLSVNDGAVKMYRYKAEEIVGKTPDFLGAPGMNNIEEIITLMQSVFETGNSVSFNYWGKRKNGEFFPKEVICNKGVYNGNPVIIATARDITERFKADENIKLNEKKFRTLLDTMTNVAIQGFTSDGLIKYWNKSSENLFQYSNSDVLGKSIFELLIPPWQTSKFTEHIKYMYESNIELPAEELTLKRKDGQLIHVFSSYSIIETVKNEKEVFCILVDLSATKEFEKKLIKEQKLLRTLIDNLPITIYIKDKYARKIISNKADLKIIGVESESEIIGKTDKDFFNEEIGNRGFSSDLEILNTGIPLINREEIFYNQNGEKRWLLTSKIPLFDSSGEVTGLVGIGLDITDRKNDEEKILKLSKGIEQSPASIIITDSNGIIEYVNPKFCESSGYEEKDVIGQLAWNTETALLKIYNHESFWDKINSGEIWSGEVLSQQKDKTQYWESVIITAIKNEKDGITNFIAIKENITQRKKMQEELIKAKEEAEEGAKLKSAFLANMSHEIRTPLNSIIGFSELLNDPDFEQEQKSEFINTIIENGNSLLVIISDIMDLSMLDSGQIKLRKETINCKRLISGLLNDFSKQASIKGIEIKSSNFEKLPEISIESDLYRIKQILNNLIGNSLKFTHNGYIDIGYEVIDDMIKFHVKDTGIGIATENHKTIFERFRQVDTARTRKYGGNGLGLAISKNLTNLLGGQIWIESEKEKYAHFFFTIPINYSGYLEN